MSTNRPGTFNRPILSLLVFLFLTFVGGYEPVLAQQAKAPAKAPEAPKTAVPPGLGDFTYSAGRDPFTPVYILKKVKEAKERVGAAKTGYELEELKLTGILKTGKDRYAMMEDTQGRGMLFKKGDHINSELWVDEVQDTRLVLAYKTRGGPRKIVMDIPRK